MNLKNNIKSKQIQTVRHNPDKDSCLFVNVFVSVERDKILFMYILLIRISIHLFSLKFFIC